MVSLKSSTIFMNVREKAVVLNTERINTDSDTCFLVSSTCLLVFTLSQQPPETGIKASCGPKYEHLLKEREGLLEESLMFVRGQRSEVRAQRSVGQ